MERISALGSPSERVSGLSRRVVKSSGGFPSHCAAYTTVCPSGANRAVEMPAPRNVSCRKRGGDARDRSTRRPSRCSGQRRQQRGRQTDPSPSRPAPRSLEPHSGLARELRDVLAQGREVSREVLRRRVAVPRLLGEAALDDPAQLGGNLGIERRNRLRLRPNDRRECLRPGGPLERPLACHHLVEDRAEGELIGPEIHRLPGRLLGRHVTDGPHDDAGLGRAGHRRDLLRRSSFRVGMRQLREAEIEDLDEAVAGDHDVLGFQVPVNDARGMSLGQPVGHLSANREQLAERKRTAIELLPQRLSVHQLHDDERGGIAEPDLVDRHDVGMVQGGGQARLRLEALQAGRVRSERGRQTSTATSR